MPLPFHSNHIYIYTVNYAPVARNRKVTASLSPGLMLECIIVSCFWMTGPTILNIFLKDSKSNRWYCLNISGSSALSSRMILAYTPLPCRLWIQLLDHVCRHAALIRWCRINKMERRAIWWRFIAGAIFSVLSSVLFSTFAAKRVAELTVSRSCWLSY